MVKPICVCGIQSRMIEEKCVFLPVLVESFRLKDWKVGFFTKFMYVFIKNISFKFHQPLHRGSVLDHCKHGSYKKLGNTVESRICFFAIPLLSPYESHATHHVRLKNMQIYHSDGRFTSFQLNSTYITFSCTSWL
jgi:hypothetical protein